MFFYIFTVAKCLFLPLAMTLLENTQKFFRDENFDVSMMALSKVLNKHELVRVSMYLRSLYIGERAYFFQAKEKSVLTALNPKFEQSSKVSIRF